MSPTTATKRSSARTLWLAAVFLLLLPGCGSDQPYAISKTILLAVLVNLKKKKKLQFKDGEALDSEDAKSDEEMAEDRHKGWFIFRRTEQIGKRHSNFGAPDILPLVEAQFDQIVTYLNGKIGPGGPLNGFFEPGGQSPATNTQAFTTDPSHHLDLANIAVALVGDTSANREAIYRRRRWRAVRAIVWHAAGLHDELWSGGGDGTLNMPAMNEILDRRLRSVERMRLQVNGLANDATTSPNNSGRGPWLDGSRIRVFEYPYFAKSLIDNADLNVIWVDFFSDVQYVAAPLGRLITRFDSEPDTVSTTWVPAGIYQRNPGPGSLATALDTLFQSKINIWERNWLFCDHSIAGMHLEALRFAMERRGQGAAFDGLVRPKLPFLAGIIGGATYDPATGKPSTIDNDTIWQDGVSTGPADTGVFDNLFADYRDLQVGDHIILWNHHLYVFVTKGAWRLENAFVSEIDPVLDNWDEKHKSIDPGVFMKPNRKALLLDGFGETRKYESFQKELLRNFSLAYRQTQSLAAQSTANFFVIPHSAAAGLAVRWAPYSTGFDVDDPWWIFLSRVSPGDIDSPYPTVAKMKEILKFSVIDGPDRGPDYVKPPTSIKVPGEQGPRNLVDGVFFPLHVPVVKGKQMDWDKYFELRQDGSVNTTLVDRVVTWQMIPGLFVRGEDQPIQTIRPRVRP